MWHSWEYENCADKSQAPYTSKDSIKASSITDKGPFGETCIRGDRTIGQDENNNMAVNENLKKRKIIHYFGRGIK